MCSLARPLAPTRRHATFSYAGFAALPVQHDGRLEPLDSFARDFLIQFSGHDHLDDLSADAWLAELLFTPDAGYRRAVFDVPNPSVRDAIGLPARESHHYSFVEVSGGFASHRDTLDALLPEQGRAGLDPAQTQLLSLYTNTLWYFEISRSLSLVLPDFVVRDPALAAAMRVPPGQGFDYLEMVPRRPAFLAYALPRLKDDGTPSGDVLRAGDQLRRLEIDKESKILRVIPPQWAGGGEEWLSPWAILQAGAGSPQTVRLFAAWRAAGDAYRAGDDDSWKRNSAALAGRAGMAGNWRLPLEVLYNGARPFRFSLAAYVLSFLLLLGGWSGVGPARWLRRAASCALIAGAALHAAGLAMRIVIMERPPVGTLYESILFVGLVAVLSALALEARMRNQLGLLVGAAAGSVLQFIGLRYAAGGNTMSPLVAVLNTNFWLATHVTCVTIGYGASLVTGLLAHLWLLQKILRPAAQERHSAAMRAMTGAALVALLFATTGTILGGIWADQSWGRFWGWDPKENGALLIVLWLLWLLHGRLSGLLRPAAFALGGAATTVVVALSWFGVNLLGVGLHSYGFTAGIAFNLFAFCAGELGLIATAGFLLSRRSA